MKILNVVTDRDRRGAQVFATDLHRGLVDLGHTVSTVALSPGNHGDLLPIESLGASPRSWRTLRALRRLGRDHDIVVAHGSSTLLACALALTGSGTPFVYRQISDPLFWAATWTRRARVAVMIRQATTVVALSPTTSEVLQRHYRLSPDRIVVIPNAVPATRFHVASAAERSTARARLDIPADSCVVASLGALVPEKGVDVVVHAVSTTDGTIALVAGDGPDRHRLEALAARVAPGRVHFTGPIDDALDIYLAADIVMLPSRGGDSMPAVLIEAALCGLPAITTPVGAIEDVVLNGVTGVVVAIDDTDAAASALATLAGDHGKRSAFGAAANSHATEHFTIESTAATWASLLTARVVGDRHA